MQPLSLDYVSTYVPFCLFPYIFLHFTYKLSKWTYQNLSNDQLMKKQPNTYLSKK